MTKILSLKKESLQGSFQQHTHRNLCCETSYTNHSSFYVFPLHPLPQGNHYSKICYHSFALIYNFAIYVSPNDKLLGLPVFKFYVNRIRFITPNCLFILIIFLHEDACNSLYAK